MRAPTLIAALCAVLAGAAWVIWGTFSPAQAACFTRADLQGGLRVTLQEGLIYDVHQFGERLHYRRDEITEPGVFHMTIRDHGVLGGAQATVTPDGLQPGSVHVWQPGGWTIDALLDAGTPWVGEATVTWPGNPGWGWDETLTITREGESSYEIGGCSYRAWHLRLDHERSDQLGGTFEHVYAPDLGIELWVIGINQNDVRGPIGRVVAIEALNAPLEGTLVTVELPEAPQ